MALPWNVDRVLLLASVAATFLSMILFTGGDPGMVMQFAPAFPGMIAGLLLVFLAPAWLYLVAGILLALLPLMVLFVFGAVAGLGQPANGGEYQALLLLVLAGALGLTAGITGFLQTRRGTNKPVRETLRTPHGLTLVLAAVLVAGMFVTSGLASAQLRSAVSTSTNIVPDETVTLVTKDFAFAPAEVKVPAGKIVALVVKNEDPAAHTFTYDAGDDAIDALVPGNGQTTILLRFDAPQTIPFWCAPHSGGAEDDGTGMVGTLVVE